MPFDKIIAEVNEARSDAREKEAKSAQAREEKAQTEFETAITSILEKALGMKPYQFENYNTDPHTRRRVAYIENIGFGCTGTPDHLKVYVTIECPDCESRVYSKAISYFSHPVHLPQFAQGLKACIADAVTKHTVEWGFNVIDPGRALTSDPTANPKSKPYDAPSNS